MAYNKYTFRVDQLRGAKQFTLDCIDAVFINSGNTTVYVEDLEIAPGQNFNLNGNLGEVCQQGVNISFGAGSNPFLQIVQRQYL